MPRRVPPRSGFSPSVAACPWMASSSFTAAWMAFPSLFECNSHLLGAVPFRVYRQHRIPRRHRSLVPCRMPRSPPASGPRWCRRRAACSDGRRARRRGGHDARGAEPPRAEAPIYLNELHRNLASEKPRARPRGIRWIIDYTAAHPVAAHRRCAPHLGLVGPAPAARQPSSSPAKAVRGRPRHGPGDDDGLEVRRRRRRHRAQRRRRRAGREPRRTRPGADPRGPGAQAARGRNHFNRRSGLLDAPGSRRGTRPSAPRLPQHGFVPPPSGRRNAPAAGGQPRPGRYGTASRGGHGGAPLCRPARVAGNDDPVYQALLRAVRRSRGTRRAAGGRGPVPPRERDAFSIGRRSGGVDARPAASEPPDGLGRAPRLRHLLDGVLFGRRAGRVGFDEPVSAEAAVQRGLETPGLGDAEYGRLAEGQNFEKPAILRELTRRFNERSAGGRPPDASDPPPDTGGPHPGPGRSAPPEAVRPPGAAPRRAAGPRPPAAPAPRTAAPAVTSRRTT